MAVAFARNIVYVGIADASYYLRQLGVDSDFIRNFPISQGTYVYSTRGGSELNFSHNPLTLLGALENVQCTLGDMLIKDFPSKHHLFRKLVGHRGLDDYTAKILVKRFGEGNVALARKGRAVKVS